MMNILNKMTFLKLYIFVTFFHMLFGLKQNKKTTKILFLIVFLFSCNELITLMFPYHKNYITLITNLTVIFHFVLNMELLYEVSQTKKIRIFIVLFLIFGLLNLISIQGAEQFNYFTFVTGSMIYITFFIFESFKQLKKENLHFFLANDFTIISAPVLFFIGFSFIFGFQNKVLTRIIMFQDFKLYDLISYFCNIIYYTLINLYIYKERKLKNV